MRDFYEQNGYKVKRPLTIVEQPVIEQYNRKRNDPSLEYKNRDMLQLEQAMKSNYNNKQ